MKAASRSPRARLEAERGNVLAYGLFCTLLVILGLALVVDMGLAMATAIHQNSMMQVTREETQSTGNAFVVKNENRPLDALAQQITESLRAQGYEGQIDIDAYEPGRGETRNGTALPANKRLIVYEIQLEGSSPALISQAAGLSEIPVDTSGNWYLTLYSNAASWRANDSAICSRYIVRAGDSWTRKSSWSISLSETSSAFQSKLDQAFKSLNQ